MNRRQKQQRAERRAAHAARRDNRRPKGAERLSVQRRARDARREAP